MRIVVLTNEQPHHQFLCSSISQRHNVVGILHPDARSPKPGPRLRSVRRAYGGVYALLWAGAKLPSKISGWQTRRRIAAAERTHFPYAEKDYARIDAARIFRNVDVSTQAAVDLIVELSPDVVINLGGAIYREEFIHSCGLFLNYHSGISPIYNGSGTVNYAFANGHPHLCGGTLMTMSTVIDGGAILAHYLPAIEPQDTPASLSMKTYAGAAMLYDRFLTALAAGDHYACAPQHRPMFYVKGANWTLYQSLMTDYHLKHRLPDRYLRDETVVEYWRQPDDGQAEALLSRTLAVLLWGAS